MEVREAYCREDFEWDQLQRLAIKDTKEANVRLMRSSAVASLKATEAAAAAGGGGGSSATVDTGRSTVPLVGEAGVSSASDGSVSSSGGQGSGVDSGAAGSIPEPSSRGGKSGDGGSGPATAAAASAGGSSGLREEGPADAKCLGERVEQESPDAVAKAEASGLTAPAIAAAAAASDEAAQEEDKARPGASGLSVETRAEGEAPSPESSGAGS